MRISHTLLWAKLKRYIVWFLSKTSRGNQPAATTNAAFLAFIVFSLFAFPQYSLAEDSRAVETIWASTDMAAENLQSALPSEQDENFAPANESATTLLVVHATTLRGHTAPQSPRPINSWRMWITATAYSSTPDQTDDTPFITARGTTVRDGIIAANFLRFGTKVRLPTAYGDKIFEVEDRMNPRYQYRVDIWMPTRYEAKQFGIRTIPIEIVTDL